MGNLRQRSPATFGLGLLMAFNYGVLHTLGPGHGKAVIIAYFVGQGGSLQRGYGSLSGSSSILLLGSE